LFLGGGLYQRRRPELCATKLLRSEPECGDYLVRVVARARARVGVRVRVRVRMRVRVRVKVRVRVRGYLLVGVA
jgi:hypothetical protein